MEYIKNKNEDVLELEENGQVGATGAVGGEEGKGGREEEREEGQLGERGLVEVKNSWTLWCWRTWPGRAVRHLGVERERERERGGGGGERETGGGRERERRVSRESDGHREATTRHTALKLLMLCR